MQPSGSTFCYADLQYAYDDILYSFSLTLFWFYGFLASIVVQRVFSSHVLMDRRNYTNASVG